MTTGTALDRPARIRRALRDLVAEQGFHGASMSAVAKAAGVATGTAYVHYDSKEELVYATYLELKRALGEYVLSRIDGEALPGERYGLIWRAIYEHLTEDPARARFLTQLEASPYYEKAHQRLIEEGDPLMEEAARPDLAELLIPLPPEVLYSLSIGHAVRLAAAGVQLNPGEIDSLIEATWRAITRPEVVG